MTSRKVRQCLLILMFLFITFDNFLPNDFRTYGLMKSFYLEAEFSSAALLYAACKYKHISFFFLLFILLEKQFKERSWLKSFAVVLILSVYIEFQQCFMSGRNGRVQDLLPNLMGATFATVFLNWRNRKASVLKSELF